MLNFDKMLKEAISREILTISEVDDMLKMTRKKLVEQKHPLQLIAVRMAE